MIGYFNLVNNLNNYVNYYFIIIIVPEKPLWGGSIKYVCMYVLTKHCEKLSQIKVRHCPDRFSSRQWPAVLTIIELCVSPK